MTIRITANRVYPYASRAITFVFLLAAAVFSMNSAAADIITMDALDSGFVTEMGGSAKGDGTIIGAATYNYSVGQELHYVDGSLGMPPGSTPLAYMDRNNYFVFDLSSVSGPIVSATLVLPAGLFESIDPTETFHLVVPGDPGAAISDAEMLLVGNSIGFTEFDEVSDPLVGVAAALYGNIEAGSGDILATSVISSGDDFMDLSIELDPIAMDYLNFFSGGPVFLGGDVSTITVGPTTQQPFGGTGLVAPKLILTTVPEPSSMWLFGLAIVAASFRHRRR